MNQFFTFMLDWSLKSTVTVLLGFGCVLLLRKRSAATRHLVWRITLVALALLPFAMALSPKAGAPAVMEPIQAPVRAVFYQIQPVHPVRVFRNPVLASAAAATQEQGSYEEQIAGGIYALGLLAMLGFWLTGYSKIARIARSSRSVSHPYCPHPVLVAQSSELRVPITFGAFLPVILLPKESGEWPEQRVRAAILHESAHIARKDWAWQTASNLMRALQWFNPALWLMNSAIQTTSEAATDDEVVTRFGMGPTTYATELLKVAEAASGNVFTATAMARRGGVSGRLRRIVAEGVDRARPRRRLAVGLGLGFSAAGILVAAGTVAEAAGADVAGQTARLLHSPLGSSVLSLGNANTSTASTAGYTAKLSHGGIVRMVAITGPQDDKGPMWRPDGSVATQADRTLLQVFFGHHPEFQAPSEGRVINFYLQVSKLPMKDGETENGIFRIKPNGNWQYQGGSNTFARDGRLQWDRWLAPANARTCDMDCAISYGGFQPYASGKLNDEKSPVRLGAVQGEWVTVSVHEPGSFGDVEGKLECYDSDGNLITGGGEAWRNGDGNNGQHYDFNYKLADAQRIDSYKFGIRKYEHVLIKGIRLPPNTAKP